MKEPKQTTIVVDYEAVDMTDAVALSEALMLVCRNLNAPIDVALRAVSAFMTEMRPTIDSARMWAELMAQHDNEKLTIIGGVAFFHGRREDIPVKTMEENNLVFCEGADGRPMIAKDRFDVLKGVTLEPK